MSEERKGIRTIKNTIIKEGLIITSLVRDDVEIALTDLSHFPRGESGQFLYSSTLALREASSAIYRAAQDARKMVPNDEDAMIRAILKRSRELEKGTYTWERTPLHPLEKAKKRFYRKHGRKPNTWEVNAMAAALDLGYIR